MAMDIKEALAKENKCYYAKALKSRKSREHGSKNGEKTRGDRCENVRK
jgi:hypothetical protein